MNGWLKKVIVAGVATGSLTGLGMGIQSFVSTVYANKDDLIRMNTTLPEIARGVKEIQAEQQTMNSRLSRIEGRLERSR